eukprot:Blabericola_migrator_1__1739@NODE_146_length_12961_cov_103_787110_g127_i0_p10_GENE_NODE_146_length_12961_cov_103_787110_g127_i0NODE_146_length_12961_cov_103_787110_g127_i0_p10_ORF_typecomplete_len111_score18_97_NODE_146_length_12961_cov_103_787110_g127_i0310642
MSSYVQASRWMDSAVLALFLMLISASALHLFAHLWAVAQRPEFAQYKVGEILKTLFKFSNRFDFNLTHILLLSIIICLLSLRPDAPPPVKPVPKEKRTPKEKTGEDLTAQ